MLTRILTVPALLLVLVPACDKHTLDAPNDSADSAEPVVDSEEEEEEDKEEPVADFSKAGEVCTPDEDAGACQVGGVAGLEFCAFFNDDYQWKWTQCLTETCPT